MKFLRNLLAAILGFLIGLFVFFMFFYVIIVAIAASSGDSVEVEENSILKIDLTAEVHDRVQDSPFGNMDIGAFKTPKKLGLNDILKNIKKAGDDDRIKGIVLKAPYINASFGGGATVKEIRQALKRFKETGKFIYAYNQQGYSQKAYYLSTVADSIFIHPEADMMFIGLGGQMAFYPKMFKKIGVEAEIIRHGKYKAAVEPFMLDKMSEENKEQTMKYVSSMWDQMLEAISEDRGVSVEELNKTADEISIRTPDDAIAKGLVDGKLYSDEFTALLKEKLGVTDDEEDDDEDEEDDDEDEEDELEFVSLGDYKKVKPEKKNKAKDEVAVVYAEGSIYGDGDKSIGPKLAETLREVRKDEDIKAVVLRINSPGGSALISDLIWREVDLISKEKPIVASLGNVAASGGYYIACAADSIIASPNTITGSIGVFGVLFNGEELIKGKIGISTDEYATNKHSNFGGGYFGPLASRKLNDFEKEFIQGQVEDVYDVFISHVADGRNMTKEQVDEIGQGRVWIGKDAKEIGLVDAFGGLKEAVEIAKNMAKLEACKIAEYPKQKDPIEEFLSNMSGTTKAMLLEEELGGYYEHYQRAKAMINHQGVQAALPYDLDIR